MIKPWLQYLILIVWTFDVIYAICNHDKIKIKRYDGFREVLAFIICFSIYFLGGFFDGLLR